MAFGPIRMRLVRNAASRMQFELVMGKKVGI